MGRKQRRARRDRDRTRMRERPAVCGGPVQAGWTWRDDPVPVVIRQDGTGLGAWSGGRADRDEAAETRGERGSGPRSADPTAPRYNVSGGGGGELKASGREIKTNTEMRGAIGGGAGRGGPREAAGGEAGEWTGRGGAGSWCWRGRGRGGSREGGTDRWDPSTGTETAAFERCERQRHAEKGRDQRCGGEIDVGRRWLEPAAGRKKGSREGTERCKSLGDLEA